MSFCVDSSPPVSKIVVSSLKSRGLSPTKTQRLPFRRSYATFSLSSWGFVGTGARTPSMSVRQRDRGRGCGCSPLTSEHDRGFPHENRTSISRVPSFVSYYGKFRCTVENVGAKYSTTPSTSHDRREPFFTPLLFLYVSLPEDLPGQKSRLLLQSLSAVVARF